MGCRSSKNRIHPLHVVPPNSQLFRWPEEWNPRSWNIGYLFGGQLLTMDQVNQENRRIRNVNAWVGRRQGRRQAVCENQIQKRIFW